MNCRCIKLATRALAIYNNKMLCQSHRFTRLPCQCWMGYIIILFLEPLPLWFPRGVQKILPGALLNCNQNTSPPPTTPKLPPNNLLKRGTVEYLHAKLSTVLLKRWGASWERVASGGMTTANGRHNEEPRRPGTFSASVCLTLLLLPLSIVECSNLLFTARPGGFFTQAETAGSSATYKRSCLLLWQLSFFWGGGGVYRLLVPWPDKKVSYLFISPHTTNTLSYCFNVHVVNP